MDSDCDFWDETMLNTRACAHEHQMESGSQRNSTSKTYVPTKDGTDTGSFAIQWPTMNVRYRETKTEPVSVEEVLRAFLLSLYEYSERRDVGRGSLLVVKQIDSLMRCGNFSGVDWAMQHAYVGRLDPEIAFSFLTITAPARQLLDAETRQLFLAQTRSRLLETRSPQYVDELLMRYK